MRPLRLEMTAFLSYKRSQVLDFEPLYDDGLFLITGSTGAGKSTVLQAMSFALYGKALGQLADPQIRKDGDVLVKWRSADVPDDVKTEVVFEVAIADRVYRFRRTPEYFKSGSGAKVNHKASVEELVDGVWVTRASGPNEVGALASECLRMTADQFAQLVILPQGKFAEFLNSSMAQREEILTALFPVGSFVAVREWFKQRRAEAEQAVGQLLRQRSDAVVAIRAVTGDDGEGTPADIAAWISGLAEEIEQARVNAAESESQAQDEFAAANAEYAQAEARSEALIRLNSARARAEAAEAALAEITALVADEGISQPYSSSLPSVIANLKAARDADQAQIDALSKVTEAQAAVHKAAEQLRAGEADHEAAEKKRASHQQSLEDFQSELDSLGNVEAALAPTRAELARWETHRESVAELEEMSEALETLRSEHAEAKASLAAATKAVDRIVSAMNKSAAADLAELLVDGEPCLVCGSPEHPKPARAARTQVEQEEYDDAVDTQQQWQTRLDEWADGLKTAEADYKAASKQVQKARLPTESDAIEKAIAGLEEDISRLNTSLQRSESLTAALRKGAEDSESYTKAVTMALAAVSDRKVTVAVAEAALETARRQAPAGIDGDALTTRVNAAGSRIATLTAALEKAQGAETEATQAHAIVEASEAAAAGAVADIAPLKAALDAAQMKLNSAAALQKKMAEQLTKLREYAQVLEGIADAADAAIANVDRWKRISEYVEGNAGRKIPIERFYLGYRLKQVAAAASIHLLTMSGQQFQFEHSDTMQAARGARGGLALAIRDLANDDLRDPGTLSGGETFMASLALALGLSDVVSAEAGGQRLESLFVDEGFGTLDNDGTLDEVMGIFDGLRTHGRLVGIISHVGTLKERIPTQVKVTKTADGSQIRVVTDGAGD